MPCHATPAAPPPQRSECAKLTCYITPWVPADLMRVEMCKIPHAYQELPEISPVTPTLGPLLPPAFPFESFLLITLRDRASHNDSLPMMMLKSQSLAL